MQYASPTNQPTVIHAIQLELLMKRKGQPREKSVGFISKLSVGCLNYNFGPLKQSFD